jgi:CRP/FNR family transcriptional regulator
MSVEPMEDLMGQGTSGVARLNQIDDPAWSEVLAGAAPVSASAGTVMLCKGDPCSSFLLVTKGSMRVHEISEAGREIVLYRVFPGDVCVLSLSSLVDGAPFAAEAVTETDMEGIALSPQEFQKALADSSGFRNFVLSTLARRMCDVLARVEEIAFRRLDHRLACTLFQLFEQKDTDHLKITHQELAKELGTTREVTSRLLKDFEQKQGCIRLRRGSIELLSRTDLESLARGDFV